jgi:hypothetical protein
MTDEQEFGETTGSVLRGPVGGNRHREKRQEASLTSAVPLDGGGGLLWLPWRTGTGE